MTSASIDEVTILVNKSDTDIDGDTSEFEVFRFGRFLAETESPTLKMLYSPRTETSWIKINTCFLEKSAFERIHKAPEGGVLRLKLTHRIFNKELPAHAGPFHPQFNPMVAHNYDYFVGTLLEVYSSAGELLDA